MSDTGDVGRASASPLQAFQHAVGVNLVDVAAWIGPVIGAAWLWTGSHVGTSLLPDESPLRWFGRLADSLFGLHFRWPTDVDRWLHEHKRMSFVLIPLAIFSATRSRSSGVTFIALLLAISVTGPIGTIWRYLGLSLGLCGVAIGLDALGKEAICIPAMSFLRWFRDCAGPLFVTAFAPFVLAGYVVERFRTPDTDEVFGFELTSKLKQLPDLPVAEVRVRDLANVLAHVVLLAHDDKRRQSALFSINRFRIEKNVRV